MFLGFRKRGLLCRYLDGVQVFYEGEGSGGGGGGETEAEKERRNLDNLLAKKNGDGVALAAQLLGENNNLREDKRKLKVTLSELQGKVPGEGMVLLSADDASAWNAYRELGTPAELKAAVTERDTFKADKDRLEGENATVRRDSLLRDVAADTHSKFAVLKDRDERTPGLEYLKKTVKVDGKDVDQWFVKFKDGDGENAPVKELAYDDFAAEKWSDFLPALKAEPAQEEKGTRHVVQGSGGSNAGGTRFDQIRERNKKEREAGTQQSAPSLETIMHIGTNTPATA